MDYLTVLIAASLGAFTQGLTGIGFAVIYISICSFFLPYVTNLISMKFIITIVSTPIVIKYFKKIRWNYLLIPFVFSFVGNAVAMWMLKSFNEIILSIILGLFMAATGVFNILSKKEWYFSGGVVSGIIVGLLVGFFSGVCGMAGPILALYYMGIKDLTDEKDCYYATTITLFYIVGLYQLIMYLFTDFIPVEAWKYIISGTVPAFITMFLGVRSFTNSDIGKVKLFLNYFMVVMGLFLAISNVI